MIDDNLLTPSSGEGVSSTARQGTIQSAHEMINGDGSSWTQAIQKELSKLLSQSMIFADDENVAAVNRATFQTSTASRLIVQPSSLEDVCQTVRYAAAQKLSIYPVSCGLNWGFGSKVPTKDVAILLDLSRLNRISEFDAEFGTVKLEPGVTFRQLHDFLSRQGSHFFLNTIGGSPNASVLGNILEKGDGVGPYWDRAEYICSSEVVLADGSLVKLGFGNYEQSKLSSLSHHAPGAHLDGLFLQSNVGIVIGTTLWLHPLPRHFRSFHFAFEDSKSLAPALSRLRQLYLRDLLSAPVVFWNDYRQVASSIQYPWEIAKHRVPLERKILKSISNNYSAWIAFGGIYQDHEKISRLIYQELARALGPYAKKPGFLSTLSTRKMEFLRLVNRFLQQNRFNFTQLLQAWDKHVLLGTPTDIGIRSTYWRKKTPPQGVLDPNADLCGVLWNAFEIPFDGALISEQLEIVEEKIMGYGFEPIISLTSVNHRYVKIFQQLIFDRSDPEEDLRAIRCHEDVFTYLEEQGFNHTRLDIRAMRAMQGRTKGSVLMQRIKIALDPDGILSPGRYGFDN